MHGELRPFERIYNCKFTLCQTRSIVVDTMCSDFLPTWSRATYICYTQCVTLVICRPEILTILQACCDSKRRSKTLRISHLNSHVFYCCATNDSKVLTEAANFFVNNPYKSNVIHTTSFYTYGTTIPEPLRELYNGLEVSNCNEFHQFLKLPAISSNRLNCAVRDTVFSRSV